MICGHDPTITATPRLLLLADQLVRVAGALYGAHDRDSGAQLRLTLRRGTVLDLAQGKHLAVTIAEERELLSPRQAAQRMLRGSRSG